MVSTVKELECWRLADQLRTAVCAICDQEKVARHYKFCDGFTEAAGSVCRNISEGFGRGGSPSIAQFCGYALGSVAEVADYLQECHTRRFIDKGRLEELLELLEHARATTQKFKAYHERKAKSAAPASRAAKQRVYSYIVPD
jgi:four helix bundle protein